jgi:hypothetical protein
MRVCLENRRPFTGPRICDDAGLFVISPKISMDPQRCDLKQASPRVPFSFMAGTPYLVPAPLPPPLLSARVRPRYPQQVLLEC